MAGYDIGGGGGKAPGFSDSARFTLDKPYDISGGTFTGEMADKIDEMFRQLYGALVKAEDRVVAAEADIVAISSDVLVQITTLTSSQLNALDTTPITVVPAPGAGKIVLPLHWGLEVNVSVGYGGSGPFRIIHEGSTIALVTTVDPSMGSTGYKLQTTTAVTASFVYSTFDLRNKAVQIEATSAFVAPGTATARVYVTYAVIPSE